VIHTVLKTPIEAPVAAGQEEAVFGMGCFWGVERKFWKVPGVVTTSVGYACGTREPPTHPHRAPPHTRPRARETGPFTAATPAPSRDVGICDTVVHAPVAGL